MTSPSFEKLVELTCRRYKVEPTAITPEGDIFETLGIDSFAAVELMSELEIEFDVELPDYEMQTIRTFADLANAIDQRR